MDEHKQDQKDLMEEYETLKGNHVKMNSVISPPVFIGDALPDISVST